MPRWKDKVVVVTGGSSGLGAAIVESFARAGATAISVARTEPAQKELVDRLRKEGLAADFVIADVTDDQSVNECVNEIVTRHSRIDVWVNNVGQSIRVAFADADVEAHKRLMEINFYSAVHCSMAVLPELEKSSGSLVNVGSLASKTGWRLVSPYVTSKHALAGFAHQLRLETAPSIHTMLVCPGPIRRADEASRYQEAADGLGVDAAKPGAGVKLKGIDPLIVAQKIVIGCERRKAEIVMPAKSRVAFAVLQLWPKLGDWILRKFSGQ